MINIVLIEPEIPQNTGNIARSCLAAGARLHLVEPLGFTIDSTALKRAGMDYWHLCDVHRWPSFNALRSSIAADARFFFLTTKSTRPYWNATFMHNDYLVFGRETKGLPESLLKSEKPNLLTIPIAQSARSLNLATSVGIVLFEANRQLCKL